MSSDVGLSFPTTSDQHTFSLQSRANFSSRKHLPKLHFERLRTMGFDLPSKWTSRQEARFLRYAHWFTLITTSVMIVICIVRIGLRLNGVGVNRSTPGGASASWGTGVVSHSPLPSLAVLMGNIRRPRVSSSLCTKS